MYRRLSESSGNVLAYDLEVELTSEDVEGIHAELAAAIEEHDAVRLLVMADRLQAIEPAAVWRELRMTPDLLAHVERLAVVGDERWHAWVETLSDTLAEAESFEPDALATALEWVGAEAGTS
ncbi:MAG: STAS/SEC14 domain-containing protein [Nitriliruptoraceae bacterium]